MNLCHHFMLVLYTRVCTRFMPRVHRLALYQVDLQVGKRPRQPGRVRFRLRLRRLRGDRRRPPVGSVRTSGRPHHWGDFGQIPPGAGFPRSAGGGLGCGLGSSGTSFLMNPVLPVCFMMAYAVALFCFMLVLCSTRGFVRCLCVSLCTSLCGVYAV